MQTLDTYFETWIVRKKQTVKQATLYRYERWYQNHISYTLGEKNLNEITQRDVVQLEKSVAAVYSISSANYTVSILRSILNAAKDDDLIEYNPAARMKRLQSNGQKFSSPSRRILTEAEQLLFMQAARDSFYYEFFALLLLTGLRHGEAAALTWKDIDWAANVIRVRQTLTFDLEGHTIIGPPKSAASCRDLPMNDDIEKILQSQMRKSRNLDKTDALIHPKGNRRVFFHCLHPDGFLNNRTANIELRKILHRMEDDGNSIPPFTLHTLRDTFAGRYIEQGGDPKILKKLLGHSNLTVTKDLYSGNIDKI